MQRLNAVDLQTADGKAKELLDGVQKKLGMTPNMMRTMANSPAVLEAYLNFSSLLSTGKLNARLREQIAITVAEANACEYCLSAHSAIGKMVGLSEDEISANRQSKSNDAKTEAALNFAHRIVVSRGELNDADVNIVRQAGFDDGEIAELIANVALNIFTNYFNHIAQTVLDFPRVALTAKGL
jgi:uncharacterized peroxidase-related enzyme